MIKNFIQVVPHFVKLNISTQIIHWELILFAVRISSFPFLEVKWKLHWWHNMSSKGNVLITVDDIEITAIIKRFT